MKKELYFLWIFIFSVTFISCKKDKEPTLQEYLIETKQNPKYRNLDISTSMIDGYLSLANEKIPETIKSVRKINLVGLQARGNEEEYELEKAKLDAVFAKTKKYKPLIKVKKQGIKLNLFYKGTSEKIDEVIVYAHAKEYGLGVARLTGENIKTDKIIELVNKTEIPQGILDGYKIEKLRVEPVE